MGRLFTSDDSKDPGKVMNKGSTWETCLRQTWYMYSWWIKTIYYILGSRPNIMFKSWDSKRRCCNFHLVLGFVVEPEISRIQGYIFWYHWQSQNKDWLWLSFWCLTRHVYMKDMHSYGRKKNQISWRSCRKQNETRDFSVKKLVVSPWLQTSWHESNWESKLLISFFNWSMDLGKQLGWQWR